jgi:hypothetical protein
LRWGGDVLCDHHRLKWDRYFNNFAMMLIAFSLAAFLAASFTSGLLAKNAFAAHVQSPMTISSHQKHVLTAS